MRPPTFALVIGKWAHGTGTKLVIRHRRLGSYSNFQEARAIVEKFASLLG